MADWDSGAIYAAPASRPVQSSSGSYTKQMAIRDTRSFIVMFTRDDIPIYRENLINNVRSNRYFVEIDLEDLKNRNEILHDNVISHPNEYIHLMELGAREVVISFCPDLKPDRIPPIQILFVSGFTYTTIRSIEAFSLNKLIRVPGIVVNASRTRPKAYMIVIRCKNCGTELQIPCPTGLGGVQIPRMCIGRSSNTGDGSSAVLAQDADKCPMDPFIVIPDSCKYLDQQTLKLQELPEDVPIGEVPRHITLHLDRVLTDRVPPGTRISVLAVASITSDKGRGGGIGAQDRSVRRAYLRAVGISALDPGSAHGNASFSPEEEEKLHELSRVPDVYEVFAKNVAPSISGDYTHDIKRAIVCLLLGGSRRVLADGARLRGDINVLLLGDPSTAKSQFLKFVELVAPIGVYTSGKGSSAAGLTASVTRDARGEFYLEGGAMVLGDGGVVCIDEFDKMREEDRVAIHEAMEQQTISVAKAGITTILNSRCSVLAAANPIFGRYDDSRTAGENIDLLPTILSRFDLIFIVRDVRDEQRDLDIARHVVRVNMNGNVDLPRADSHTSANGSQNSLDLDIATMKRYVGYARSRCAPTLSEASAAMLAGKYAEIRAQAHQMNFSATGTNLAPKATRDRASGGTSQGAIPITVRQLEALIRLSEAVAKASLSTVVTEAHVSEALRLFSSATMAAAASGSGAGAVLSGQLQEIVKRVETRVLRLIQPNATMNLSNLKRVLLSAGFEDGVITHALRLMEKREEIAFQNDRRIVKRLK